MTAGREDKIINLRPTEEKALQEWGEHTRGFSKEAEDNPHLSRASVYFGQDKDFVFRFLLTPPSTIPPVAGLEFHRSMCINTRRKLNSNLETGAV